ncbi:MAG: spore cortex biosynthesis protein YabQ [Clostridia bacterium]|nr:spore cortex biosynthesis protein YabQ [Clostridia bacterium]
MNQSEVILESAKDLLIMFAVGFFLGFVFDVFRSIRSAVRRNNSKINDAAVILQDILFLLFAFCVIVIAVYCVNGGQLKAYIVLGCIVGFAVYFPVAAPVAGRIVFMLFFVIIKIVKFVQKYTKNVLKINKNNVKNTGEKNEDNI